MNPRQIWILFVSLAATAACTVAPAEPYMDMKQAMEIEIEPLVETTIPIELNKDTADVDFAAIHDAAIRARDVFRDARVEGRSIYIHSSSEREHSRTAESWFANIADAAANRQQQKLVQLYVQKSKICTACHKDF